MGSGLPSHGTHVYAGMDEAKVLKRTRTLHWNRLILSSLIFGAAIAIIACEVVPFQHYKSTSRWASSGLALWPLNFDLRPTVATLSCACVIAVLNLIYILVALLPSVSHSDTLKTQLNHGCDTDFNSRTLVSDS